MGNRCSHARRTERRCARMTRWHEAATAPATAGSAIVAGSVATVGSAVVAGSAATVGSAVVAGSVRDRRERGRRRARRRRCSAPGSPGRSGRSPAPAARAASDAWDVSGAADAWAVSGAWAATGCAASSARSGGAPSAMPSAEFAAATAALRRARPDDGAQAEDQLLEQLRAGEAARVTLAAAPDGVAVQEVDAGAGRRAGSSPTGRRTPRRCSTSTVAGSRSRRWARTWPSPGMSPRRRAGACWPSTTASRPSTRTRPRSTTRRPPTRGCRSRA